MNYDRADYQASIEKAKDERQRDMMPLIKVLQGAAPVMSELMTKSDVWNRYLSILQGFNDRIKASKQRAEAQLSDPSVWEPYQLMRMKSDGLCADAMLEILQTVMQLPKALIEGGAEASQIVSKFEAKHAESAGQAQS